MQVPVTVMTTQQRRVPRQVAVTRRVMVPAPGPVSTPGAVLPGTPAAAPSKAGMRLHHRTDAVEADGHGGDGVAGAAIERYSRPIVLIRPAHRGGQTDRSLPFRRKEFAGTTRFITLSRA